MMSKFLGKEMTTWLVRFGHREAQPQATSESDKRESERSLRETPSDSPGEKDVPPDTFKNKRESRSTPAHTPGPEDSQSLACL